jgi:hypothetical protein
MDRRKLRRDLHKKVDAALEKAMDAVAAAPDGRWIAGSEWVVRAAFAELMGDCFQAMVQARIDADPAAGAGSFSPGGRAANQAGVQGGSTRQRPELRR